LNSQTQFYTYQTSNDFEYQRFQDKQNIEKLHKREKAMREQLVEAQNAANVLNNTVKEMQEAMSRKDHEVKDVNEKFAEVSRYLKPLRRPRSSLM